MKTVKTEGIILKRKDLLEKDYLLTVFTKETGKAVIIAKGIKKITSRRAPHTQTGNLVDLILYKRHDIYYLQDSKLISGFVDIKKDQRKVEYMYVYFFIIDRLLPELQKEDTIYTLTKSFLISLSKTENFTTTQFTSFLQKMLQQLGYIHDTLSLETIFDTIESIIHEKIPRRVI